MADDLAAARDRALAGEVADRLAHDRRTEHLALDVAVDDGLAHVAGEVGSADERDLVRRLVRGVGGVRGAWDVLAVAGAPAPRVLDVGCGAKKRPGSVGLDHASLPGVDVVADLEGPLPLEDAAFEHVFAVHVLEHVRDLVGLMNELHRVLAPGGVLHVLCPSWEHPHAWGDPTHVRAVAPVLFRWFCEGRPGVAHWAPLAVAADAATVFADLERVDEQAPAELVARVFS